MLSGKLIRLIETHEQEITDRLLREIRSIPDLSHLRQLPEAELREGYRNLVQNLGYWLAEANELELARKYESLGKRHCDEGVPLHENVRALLLVKEKMLDFISEQGFNPDALELYAEEEMEHRVGRFFDLLVWRLVRGYENAWRKAMHAAA